MLNKQLWLSFPYELAEDDVEAIESRIQLLRDTSEEAKSCEDVEEAKKRFDLDIHTYLAPSLPKESQVTLWLIHDSWLEWHGDGKELSPPLRDRLHQYFLRPLDDLRACLNDILGCIAEHEHISTEGEAVMWLSMLDYLATRIVTRIEHERLGNIFERCGLIDTTPNTSPPTAYQRQALRWRRERHILDKNLWLSFVNDLTAEKVELIEKRTLFLEDIIKSSLKDKNEEDVRSGLDLDIHVYFKYFDLKENNDHLSPSLIHDCWLAWHNDGKELSPPLRDRFHQYFLRPLDDLRACLNDILDCIDEHKHISTEGEAVMWLSMLDYLATRIVTKIEHDRLDAIFAKALLNAPDGNSPQVPKGEQ